MRAVYERDSGSRGESVLRVSAIHREYSQRNVRVVVRDVRERPNSEEKFVSSDSYDSNREKEGGLGDEMDRVFVGEVCRTFSRFRMRGRYFLQRQFLRHLLAKEERIDERFDVFQRVDQSRRRVALRFRLRAVFRVEAQAQRGGAARDCLQRSRNRKRIRLRRVELRVSRHECRFNVRLRRVCRRSFARAVGRE